MGRSVNYVSGAAAVAFLTMDYDGEDEYGFDDALADNIESLRIVLTKRFPSFKYTSKWDGREEHRILENDLARVVVCTYGNLMSVSLAVDTGAADYGYQALAERWCRSVVKKFTAALDSNFTTLTKIGTFSNGEGVYERR